MTTLAPERSQTTPDAIVCACCAACRVIAPRDALEPVPTRPGLLRCADEDACRKRYTPRRLAKSVRTEE